MIHRYAFVFIALCCTLLAIETTNAADAAKLYGQRIVVPATTRPEVKQAVEDLRVFLKKITGEEFTVDADDESNDGPAILLRRADADAPSEAVKKLAGQSKEAFCLWPEGKRLWIVARSDLGLAHAVYIYLEQLGCRFYMASEKWTIVPQRDDIRLQRPVAAAPAFVSRMFFGTGGFGGNLPLDPKRSLQDRWLAWQRRNRFGGEFRISGHTGEAFNIAHRKQLEAHPEWRAMIDGKRVPWSLTAKFCAGNPDVVALYVEDRLKALRQTRKVDPDGPRSWAVSVEPADGGGHCTAPESLALGSVSDRVFHVANEVAKAVRKEYPDAHVSLFAYNEHAAVPSIPLEPNVYVHVIPYAFQRTGMSPDQLLDAWSRKVSRMGIYDYWSIPDWTHDLPDFDPLGFGPERLRGWHRRGVDSFLCESTFSGGAMGFAWYAAARLAWDPEADVEVMFEEYTHNCFGAGAEPMRRMLRRWSNGFDLTSHELALSYRDVDEAWKLTENDPATSARVADFGRYVEYLRRRFDYLHTKRGTDERRAAAERLMTYLWSIYDSAMIHAFRHSQLLARDERAAGNLKLAEAFDWTKHDAPGWVTIQAVSDADVRGLVRAGVRDHTPRDFRARRFTGKLVPAPVKEGTANDVVASDDGYGPLLWENNSMRFDVLAPRDGFVFRVRIATEKPMQVQVTGSDGKTVFDEAVVTGEAWRETWSEPVITLPRAGQYHVQIVSQKRTLRFMAPLDAALSLPGFSNSQGTPTPRLYFYVPAGVEQLAIYANYTAAGPPRFFDPAGTEVKPELIDDGGLLLVPIAESQRGTIWSLDRAKCPLGPLKLLNAPNSFAFSPQTLLVPEDALEEPRD